MRSTLPSPPPVDEIPQFAVYSAPSGPTSSPLGRPSGEPGQHFRAHASLAIERDEVGVVGRPLVVVGEDLDAIEPLAVPRQADDRVEGLERQRVTCKARVEHGELGRPAVLPERADVEVLAAPGHHDRVVFFVVDRHVKELLDRAARRIDTQQESTVGLDHVEVPAERHHRMEHAARFLVGGRRVGVLDEMRRVRRVPRIEVGDVGRRPVGVDPQDRGQVVGQRM